MTILQDQTKYDAAQVDTPVSQAQNVGQYGALQIACIWLAGGVPMWVLSWLIYPALSQNLDAVEAGLLRMKLLTLGLVWQFVLSLIVLYLEKGNLRLGTIRRRFRLNQPLSPKTGRSDKRLWLLLVPFLLLEAANQMGLMPVIDALWIKVFPFLAEPEGYSMAAMFTPEMQARWIGAWNLLALQAVLSLFNTFLGEEFLFRGVLLPKMRGMFGRWDWAANGVLFGLYHLHQPWGIPGCILSGLVYAFPAGRYRTTWFPIIIHSAESVYFLFLILGVVLGLAS